MRLRRAAALPLAVLVLAALVALAVAVGGARDAGAAQGPAYLDAGLSPEQRADDLLSRMSLAEKVGQMTQINATRLQGDPNNDWDRGELNPEILDLVLNQNQA